MVETATGTSYSTQHSNCEFKRTSCLFVNAVAVLQTFGYNLWKDVPMSAAILDELNELVNEGKLYPVTDSVFNVKYCERAFWFLQAAKVVGKPVIYFK